MSGLREAFSELAADVPVYGDLERAIEQADRERRHRYGVVASLAAAAAIVAVIVGVFASTGDGNRSQQPINPATPTKTSTRTATPTPATPDPALSGQALRQLRTIRDEGTAADEGDSDVSVRDRATGLEVRLYYGCEGPDCAAVGYDAVPGTPRALEVTQDGRSALFHVSDVPAIIDGDNGVGDVIRGVLVTVFDEDSVLVQDAERIGGKTRYRLLQADGTSLTLRRVADDPAPARMSPVVTVVDDISMAFDFSGYHQDLFVIDGRAGTMRPLDVPDDRIHTWAAYGALLLGTGDDCRVAWLTNDGMQERQLDCTRTGILQQVWKDSLPVGWMRQGRMAVVEWIGSRSRVVGKSRWIVHASLDYGATWQRIPIGGYGDGNVSERIGEALRQLG